MLVDAIGDASMEVVELARAQAAAVEVGDDATRRRAVDLLLSAAAATGTEGGGGGSGTMGTGLMDHD
jgi:hypothetical protein